MSTTRTTPKVNDQGIQGQGPGSPVPRTWTMPKVKDLKTECQELGQCHVGAQNLHEAANEFVTLRNKRAVKGKNKDCKRRLVRRRNARLRDAAMAVGSASQTDNKVRSDKFGSSRFTSLNNAETSVSHDRSANTLVSALMYQLPVLVLRNERKPAPASTDDTR